MESTLIAVDTAKLVFEVAEAGRKGHALVAAQPDAVHRVRGDAGAGSIRDGGLRGCAPLGASDTARRPHRTNAAGSLRLRLSAPNKTDRTDCLAMLEAAKNPEILPVPPDHQAIQGLHRCRSAWMETRTARINALRGLLREFGFVLPVGAATALKRIPEVLNDEALPSMLRPMLEEMLDEIRQLDARIAQVERQLKRSAARFP